MGIRGYPRISWVPVKTCLVGSCAGMGRVQVADTRGR